jgi:DNA primase
LTIPIKDIQGRIIGFAARAIDEITSDTLDAKYVNSPETIIFHKGSVLFGLHEARLHINTANQFWLVEGQFDVFRLWESGLLTAVAPQGTAITEIQLSTLRRYSPNLNCMLDGDDAGLRAADKVLRMAIAAGFETKFYILPKGEDPDSFLKKVNKPEFELFQNSGLSAMEFAVKYYIPFSSKTSGQQKVDALQKIYEIISGADSFIAHESFIDEISQICALDRRALAQDFAAFLQKKKLNNPPLVKSSVEEKNEVKLDSLESQLLSVVLSDVKLAKKIAAVLEPGLLQITSSAEANLLIKILVKIRESSWEGIESMDDLSIFSEEEKNVAYSALPNFPDDGSAEQVVNLCLSKLHLRVFKKKIRELDARISQISLDEKERIRNLQRDRLCLRERSLRVPRV